MHLAILDWRTWSNFGEHGVILESIENIVNKENMKKHGNHQTDDLKHSIKTLFIIYFNVRYLPGLLLLVFLAVHSAFDNETT